MSRELGGAREWQDYAAAMCGDLALSLLMEASIIESDVSSHGSTERYS